MHKYQTICNKQLHRFMINNIQIENYKSIHSLSLEMKPINMLIGSNGAGKSNFISFFKLLKNIYDGHLQQYVAMEGSSDDLLYFGTKMSDFIYGCLEFNEINKYAIKLNPNSNNSLFIEYEDVQFNRAKYGHQSLGWDHRKLSENATESELRMKFYGRFSFMNDFMQSFRVFHFHDTGKTSSLRKAALINDNEFLREDGANLPAFLYWMQEKFPKEFRKIEMTIRSIAPYFDRFNLAPDRLNDNQIRLRWKEKNSDAYFDAKHLSDGTIRFIALTTLLLQPEAPQVIIIDEPELGLHPFAINKLAGLMKKASIKTQVIVSTQSVNLVDNFEPEDIVTVDREEQQSIFKRLNSEELKEWLDNYTISDLWNKNVIGGRP